MTAIQRWRVLAAVVLALTATTKGLAVNEAVRPTYVDHAALAKLLAQTDRQELQLAGSAVNDAEMRQLAGFKHLKTLDLTATGISDDSLRHIAGLDQIESLTLRGVRLHDGGMRHLAGLTHLQHLDLADTDVGDAGLACLAALKDLRTLRLSDTLVTDAGMECVRNFKRLETLDLDDTKVTSKGVCRLDTLVELRALDLGASTRAWFDPACSRSVGVEELAKGKWLQKLEWISIQVAFCRPYQNFGSSGSACDFGLAGVRDLRFLIPLKQLHSLHLRSNELAADDLAILRALQQLEELDLGGNNLGWDALLESLPELRSLKVLDLAYAKFSVFELRCLSKFPKLEVLRLREANLGNKPFTDLPAMPNLRLLDVSFAVIETRTLEAFKDKNYLLHICREPRVNPPRRQPSRVEVFDRILVEALVPRSPDPLTAEVNSIVTQVYVGPSDLQGGSCVLAADVDHTSMQPGRLPAHRVIIIDLEMPLSYQLNSLETSDREWEPSHLIMYAISRNFGTTGPASNIDGSRSCFTGSSSYKTVRLTPEHEQLDYRQQREVAELLERAGRKPDPQRVEFLEEQTIRGSDIEAKTAVWLLLLDPIDTSAEPYLIRVMRDPHVPLSRRILVDRGFNPHPHRPWFHASERIALLRQWEKETNSPEEAFRLRNMVELVESLEINGYFSSGK